MNCSNGPGIGHLKEKPFATDSIDQLLTYYALKALEFPPPVILTPQDACKLTLKCYTYLFCVIVICTLYSRIVTSLYGSFYDEKRFAKVLLDSDGNTILHVSIIFKLIV